jgi:hypothetical protein
MADIAVRHSIAIQAPRRHRAIGAIVGAGITVAVGLALVFAGVALPKSDGLRSILLVLAVAAGAGVPVAAHLGWARSEAALSDEPAGEFVFFASGRAVIEGSLVLAILMVVGPGVRFDASDLTGPLVVEQILVPLVRGVGFTVMVWLIGLTLFGLIALPLIAPVVAAWRWVLRRVVVRRSPAPAAIDA